MERVESYEALEPILSAQLGRGVRTNAFGTEEEYRREIAANRLFLEKIPQGLLLFHDRGGFWRLNFYLRGADLPALSVDKPVVMETAHRAGDVALAETVAGWEAQGFRRAMARKRLARGKGLPGPEGAGGPEVGLAKPEEEREVAALLEESFHPLYGCLPTREELERTLADGEMVVARQGGVCGLLHFSAGRTGGRIHHLAVREDLRGQGVAAALLGEYLRRTDNARSLVWTGADNTAALRFYAKHRFAEDGWTSQVLYHL